MRGSGSTAREMATESRHGQTVPSSRASGKTIRLTEKANSPTQTEMSLRENLEMIKRMATGSIFTRTGPSIKDFGRTTPSMALG